VDPTGHDALARALAFVHPAIMVLGLVMAGLALRAGLAMRERRRRNQPPARDLLRSHLRVARPAVLLLLTGFAGGPLSALLLREWRPFGTLHAWLGIAAAGLFAAAGWLGWNLQRGVPAAERRRAIGRHGLLGTLALLVGALAAVAGMVLLP
jgi:uncharacterized membrane protein YedE/YeeE